MSRIKKGIATGLLALAGMLPVAAQEDKGEGKALDARARVECSGDLESRMKIKTTLGFGDGGIYEKLSTPIYGQFVEIGRAYDVFERIDGEDSHYDAFGIRMPASLINEKDTDVLAFSIVCEREEATRKKAYVEIFERIKKEGTIEARDVNGDGLEDLIFGYTNVNRVVFYKTDKGYFTNEQIKKRFYDESEKALNEKYSEKPAGQGVKGR